MQLPEQFSFQGQTYSVEQFLTDTKTTALFIIQDDTMRYEKYYIGRERKHSVRLQLYRKILCLCSIWHCAF